MWTNSFWALPATLSVAVGLTSSAAVMQIAAPPPQKKNVELRLQIDEMVDWAQMSNLNSHWTMIVIGISKRKANISV